MNLKWKFTLTVASLFGFVIYMVATCFLVIWFNLAPDERDVLAGIAAENLSIMALFAFLLLAGLISILRRLFKVYRHTARLHEETQVIVNANPNHRVSSSDVAETRLLADTINAFADRYQDLQQNVDAKIRAARASVEKEKNILAALMSELSQGVVVCNLEGQILLYNSQARQ
ncbi:MAG: hypothetical protein MI924_07830, partial [Chloroflexales bacterium]|nr:hypothetical protein [Chloroflexales bacterium]